MVLASLFVVGAFAAPTCAELVAAFDQHRTDSVCGTPRLRGAQAEARAHGLEDCLATAWATREVLPMPGPRKTLPAVRLTEEKLLRPQVEYVPYKLETANFYIQWGAERVRFTDEDMQAFADALELAWQREVVEMGYATPYGTDTYKMNVYIGDTGDEVPSAYAAGGYQTEDAEGFAYLVIANGLSDREFTASTASHEFFHAVQASQGTYTYQGQGAWYFEASAVWIQSVVRPGDISYADFVFGWAYLPELPINYFDYYEGSGSYTEYHQYAVGVFLRYLTDHYGGEALIQRSWAEAPRFGDPMVVLDELLREQGSSMDAAYREFAMRAGTWDFPDGEVYRANVSAIGGWSSDASSRPTGRFSQVSVDKRRPRNGGPRTYGANYWELGAALPDLVTVSFEGAAGADWSVAVATRRDGVHEQITLPLVDGVGAVDVEGLSVANEAWVVVTATAGPVDGLDTFRYSLVVDGDEVTQVVEDPEKRHCGCASGGHGLWTAAALWSVLLLRRRRVPLACASQAHTSAGVEPTWKMPRPTSAPSGRARLLGFGLVGVAAAWIAWPAPVKRCVTSFESRVFAPPAGWSAATVEAVLVGNGLVRLGAGEVFGRHFGEQATLSLQAFTDLDGTAALRTVHRVRFVLGPGRAGGNDIQTLDQAIATVASIEGQLWGGAGGAAGAAFDREDARVWLTETRRCLAERARK